MVFFVFLRRKFLTSRFPYLISDRIFKIKILRDPSKRRVKPADPDFLPVEAFEPEETTASDDEYQPDEKDNADDDEIITVENTRKRKIQNDHKTTSPPKLARKQKETPIGKLHFWFKNFH